MPTIYLIVLVAWIAISWRIDRTPASVKTVSACFACCYSLAGLEPGTACPECGQSEPSQQPVPGRTNLAMRPDRSTYLAAVTFVLTAGLVATVQLMLWACREGMIRHGFQPSAVDTWMVGYSPTARLYRATLLGPSGAAWMWPLALAPWLALIPRAWVRWAAGAACTLGPLVWLVYDAWVVR